MPILTQGLDTDQFNARNELHSATSSHLDTVGGRGWIVARCNQERGVDHGSCGAGIKRQSQYDAANGTMHLSLNDHQARLGVKREAQSTIAVSSGIWPVYRMAERPG